MVLTVRATSLDGVQGPDVTPPPAPLEAHRAALPAGYRIETGGATEESDKANAALFAVFPVMVAVDATAADDPAAALRRPLLVFRPRRSASSARRRRCC